MICLENMIVFWFTDNVRASKGMSTLQNIVCYAMAMAEGRKKLKAYQAVNIQFSALTVN